MECAEREVWAASGGPHPRMVVPGAVLERLSSDARVAALRWALSTCVPGAEFIVELRNEMASNPRGLDTAVLRLGHVLDALRELGARSPAVVTTSPASGVLHTRITVRA